MVNLTKNLKKRKNLKKFFNELVMLRLYCQTAKYVYEKSAKREVFFSFSLIFQPLYLYLSYSQLFVVKKVEKCSGVCRQTEN